MVELPELPYRRDALEPQMSEETVDFHYGKHHRGYVDNLNKLIKDTVYEDKELEVIVKSASGSIFNNAAQVWNHTFFWNCMTPNAPELDPSYGIAKAIDAQFGDLPTFKKKFTDAATKLFGSGWVWLVKDKTEIKIKTTKNAETILTTNDRPLLVCDMWEHAYYLNYQNNRAAYVEAFFALIDWNFVETQLTGTK